MKAGFVLVHGYSGSPADLEPLARELRRQYGPEAVASLILSGHGEQNDSPRLGSGREGELAPLDGSPLEPAVDRFSSPVETSRTGPDGWRGAHRPRHQRFDAERFVGQVVDAANAHIREHRRTVLVGHSTGGSLVLAALTQLPVSVAVFAAVSARTAANLEELVELVAGLSIKGLMLTDLNFEENRPHTVASPSCVSGICSIDRSGPSGTASPWSRTGAEWSAPTRLPPTVCALGSSRSRPRAERRGSHLAEALPYGMMRHMGGGLIFREKYIYADGSIREMVLWRLPRATASHPQGLKYRLYFGLADGTCIVRYDNETGRGDHRHSGGGKESVPYPFRDVETLVADFLADVARARGVKG